MTDHPPTHDLSSSSSLSGSDGPNRATPERTLLAWVGLGPVVMAVALVLRALTVRDEIAPVLAAIGVGLLISGVVVVRRRATIPNAAAAAVLMIGPVAIIATDARTELSYNLFRPDETGWFALTLLMGLGAGLAVAGAVVSALAARPSSSTQRPLAGRLIGVVGGALAGTAAVLGLIAVVDPQPDLGRSLSEDERAGLPTVALLDFAFAPTAVEVVDDRMRVRLENPTRLPHTFAVDSLGIDVYVPPGRVTYVDVAVPAGALDGDGARVWCSIGDHEELGMVAMLIVS